MRHSIRLIVLAWCILSIMFSIPVMADDNDDIQTEFDAICGIMEEVDGYSVEEVHGLVERIETLEAKVKTSEHPRKKVLLFRLKKCREFCQFILETKE